MRNDLLVRIKVVVCPVCGGLVAPLAHVGTCDTPKGRHAQVHSDIADTITTACAKFSVARGAVVQPSPIVRAA
jgi:hypothetical protein